MSVNITPIAPTIIQDTIVNLQPSFSDMIAMPYIEIAAPTYVNALQKPLVVAALPYFENLPGKQEMRRKLHACIQAHIVQARIRQAIRAAMCSDVISITIGRARIIVMPNRIDEPRVSFLKVLVL